MKKKYHLLGLLIGVFSVSAFSQTHTYVDGPAIVKVEKNTLFYNGGNLVLNSGALSYKNIENDGNIFIKGDYVNQSAIAKGGNFVNTWTGQNDYGQVIIDGGGSTTGYLTMQKPPINPNTFSYGQLAIPFTFDLSQNINTVKDAFEFMHADISGDKLDSNFRGECPVNQKCNNRYYQSLFVWDNEENEVDPVVASAESFNPLGYYMLNLNMFSAGYKQLYINVVNAVNGVDKFNYRGIPTPYQFPAVTFDVNKLPYTPTSQWGIGDNCEPGEQCWKNEKNVYGEKYNTFIEDPSIGRSSITAQDQSTYGKYVYQFGNPYTSNIDLSSVATQLGNDFKGAYKVIGSDTGNGGTSIVSGAETQIIGATWDGAQWMGANEALIVRPFETFMYRFTAPQSSITIPKDLKTFDYAPQSSVAKTSKGEISEFYQLKLNLLNSEKSELHNSIFILAKPSVSSGIREKFESAVTVTNEASYLYTIQEANNSEDYVDNTFKMYINGINTDFVAKPIYLGFNRSHQGEFVIQSKLYEGSIFNELTSGNFSNNNTYFFYDSKEDVLLEIDSDFQYLITSDVESNEDRYILYWNRIPDNINLGNVDLAVLNKTVIYGENDIHKIRFSKDWKSAKVSVYDLSGKLVTSDSNVDTSLDYTVELPLNNSSAYIVKVISDSGEVVTKKIVKK